MKNNKIISIVISILIGLCIGLAVGNIPTAETEATETTTATETTAEQKVFSWFNYYEEITDDLELFKVYNFADLTEETLINRNGDLIIEKVYGVVVDTEGNGKILVNDEDFKKAHNRDYNGIAEYNYYISYKGTEKAQQGDIVLSYFIYNPDSNYTDDTMARFDYIMDNVED